MTFKQLIKGLLALLWALPWTAVGIVLCVTVVLSPLGVTFLGIGAYPLKRLITRKVNEAIQIERDTEEYIMGLPIEESWDDDEVPAGY